MPFVYPKSNPGQLPPGGRHYSIDWTNPLTRGLEACYLPGIAGGTNITGKGLDLTISSANYGMSPDGPAMVTVAGSTTPPKSASIPAGNGLLGANTTLFWRGSVSAFPALDLFGVRHKLVDGTGPYELYEIALSNASPTWEIFSNSNGSEVGPASFTGPATNVVGSVGATFATGTNACIAYFNGVQAATMNRPLDPTSDTTSYIIVGGDNASDTRAATHNIACIWSRGLTAAEHASLGRNPYQFIIFDPPTWAIYHPGFWWMAENNMEAAMRTPNKNYLRR